MSGLAPDAAQPVEIQLHQVSKILEIAFDDGARFELPCEYLRVHSPSAEVRGHGVGQETLQTGKMHVGITALEPIGHYALKITFDDGHDSGLYSWTYLYELGAKRGQYWQQYLDKLAAAGASRE
ncbi:gamma-butyrobetaine hydroxylase-like domain-containing protein [Chromobacterium piscinae]|uniref:gamma-butyrobetaine hydroxylase-like domain-containing protein n=1 Tax=Chromobacterium piscinae TaxID=686831 RepID=UPI00140884F9|nr:DUF971 domain-containing protein [Chromobacterium piscinae]MBX9298125.1 DUF971 domain-containing protein [Chromobacterium vaccinii]MBX9349779.1 DUF971 domain-containing protein [Chromobacterium vaccinii]MBX9355550.1 DUF971 domain-containing protein [Chromobacterium vaccinii]MCD4506340.1 DUF971 domain-containing protein [Chromobacterium piscinae]NHQ83699.1 DUF971 domain-containing protein [Chromobacterium vaccinii]